MNPTIQFLAQMGSDAMLNSALNTAENCAAALGQTELPAHIQAMIQANDIQALKAELDVVPDVVCVFMPAEDEEDKGEEEQDGAPSKTKIAACA